MHLSNRNYQQVAQAVTDTGYNVRACAVLSEDQSLHLVVATWDGTQGQVYRCLLMWVSVNDGDANIYDQDIYANLTDAMTQFASMVVSL